MDDFVIPLNLSLDVVSLAMTLVNLESVGGAEHLIADQVETVLSGLPDLAIERRRNAVVARTDRGHAERAVLVGRLSTDPLGENLPARVEMGKLYGAGACDAKGGVAVLLKTAALADHSRDLTLVLYDGPDGLARPELLASLRDGDVAVVLAPTDAHAYGEPADHPRIASFLEIAGTASDRPGAVLPGEAAGAVELLAGLGLPVVTYGPGDPAVAGTAQENVATAQLTECEHVLRSWLRA